MTQALYAPTTRRPAPNYHTYCGPQSVASAHGITPELAAEWLVRIGAVTSDGIGTHGFGLACALGSRELYLARWHDRPPHDLTALPTAAQFLRVHNHQDDDFLLRSQEHVIHVRAGRIVCDIYGTGGRMRVISALPVGTSWPRCPCAEFPGVAVWLPPYTAWRSA
jgi:hypothetical protein